MPTDGDGRPPGMADGRDIRRAPYRGGADQYGQFTLGALLSVALTPAIT